MRPLLIGMMPVLDLLETVCELRCLESILIEAHVEKAAESFLDFQNERVSKVASQTDI